MLDFGVLPPEVTSTQMYSGPGSGPLMVAASAWDTLAAHGNSFAQGYSSAVSGLQGEHWAGPAAAAMAAAAAPYVEWAARTAVQAEQVASQLRAAAVGFETAHAAITPPAVVATNRTQLAHLVATNAFGQNAAQIAATEAAYQGMWAQNTHAMYSYAGSASSTTKLSLFAEAPQTTNPAGQSTAAVAPAAAAASQSQNWLTQLLQGLSAPGSAASSSAVDSLTSDVSTFNTLSGPTSFVLGEMRTVGNVGSFAVALGRVFADGALYAPLTGVLGGLPSELGAVAALPAAGLTSAVGPSSAGVLASARSADVVGQLSVPKAWAGATPVASFATAEEPMWLWEAESGAGHPAAGLTAASLPAGIPTEGMAAAAGMMIGRASVSNVLKVPPRRFKMSRPSSGG